MSKKGARVAKTPSDVASCDCVITMLADDAAVEQAVFGEQGFGPKLASGALHIMMSTISIELSKKLTEFHTKAGHSYVAAPVSGDRMRPRPVSFLSSRVARPRRYRAASPCFSSWDRRSFSRKGTLARASGEAGV